MSKQILDNLFGSKARVKLLKFLYRNHPRAFTVGEIARRIQEAPLEVRKELNLMKELRLVYYTKKKPLHE